MRRSTFLLNTVKETPKEAVVISHILMLRAGMIKQLASGIYTYMPFALRSMRKIENIVRSELERVDCHELLMPAVQPAELWHESGRWEKYGKELLRIKDRKGQDFCFGPTHEEVITDTVRKEVRSYKDLPLNLFQIQTKFRDEIRPRFGLMRGREFVMKDAYSFDVDDTAATKTYHRMHEAYTRIFKRCGLEFRPVEADPGNIGGSLTHEFHVLAQSGEDAILSCNQCDYAANVERCETILPQPNRPDGQVTDWKETPTPNKKTIQAVADFLGKQPSECVKTLFFRADEEAYMICLRGDHELNEIAFKNAVDATNVEMITDAETLQKYNLTLGFMSPLGLEGGFKTIVDAEVMAMPHAVVGANKVDTHYEDVVPIAHFKDYQVISVRKAQEGETCPRCQKGKFEAYRGIEVGHIFKLGTKYSEAMNATYLNADGVEAPMVMGCYGIGIGRTMAAAIEQNHDKDGIIWPLAIAPFHVNLILLDPQDETCNQTATSLYEALQQRGVEVLLDDRNQRPGFKFKDADLLGIPVHLIVGARSLKQGKLELKDRRGGEKSQVAAAGAVDAVLELLKKHGFNS